MWLISFCTFSFRNIEVVSRSGDCFLLTLSWLVCTRSCALAFEVASFSSHKPKHGMWCFYHLLPGGRSHQLSGNTPLARFLLAQHLYRPIFFGWMYGTHHKIPGSQDFLDVHRLDTCICNTLGFATERLKKEWLVAESKTSRQKIRLEHHVPEPYQNIPNSWRWRVFMENWWITFWYHGRRSFSNSLSLLSLAP